jgi:endoglucanase
MLGALAAGALAPRASASARPGGAAERLSQAGRGFNLPGIGDPAHIRQRRIEPQALAALRAGGFNAIRLPIEPALLTKGRSDTAFFLSALSLSLDDFLKAGFAVTLDMHPGPTTADLLRDHPDQGSALITEAWRQLLPLCAELPADKVMLELLNEPALPVRLWPDLRRTLAGLVREKTTSHTLVWGAANYQTMEETMADTGLVDDNAIAAVHYYYPMIFTHQGEDWSDGPLKSIRGFPFPARAGSEPVQELRRQMQRQGHSDAVALIDREAATDWTAERIRKDMARLKAWAGSTGWPVVVNEFGVYRSGARPQDRALWLKMLRTSAEACGFGWAHWEIDEGFGFMADRNDPATIEPLLRDALLGRQP